MPNKQLVEAPSSDANTVYEPLGYLEARDAVLHGEYAYAAWKETPRSGGDWRIVIKSNSTAGAMFDPTAIERKALTTAEEGKPYFTWGYSFEPSTGDPRQIEFRVHRTAEGKPREVEMYARLRKPDHSAGEPKSVRFTWPA